MLFQRGFLPNLYGSVQLVDPNISTATRRLSRDAWTVDRPAQPDAAETSEEL